MIFFGSRGKVVSGQVIEGIQCPSCENQTFTTFGTIKYFHLYWIPTFPTSKSVGIECNHCRRTLLGKELPKELSSKIKGSVFSKKNVLPTFSGTIIIACLFSFGAYVVAQDDAKESAYIAQPAIDDVYIMDFSKIFEDTDLKHKYGAMRIKQLSSSQAEFQISTIAYNKTSGVRKDIREGKASSDAYYTDKPISIDISELKSLKESGAISSIKRL